MHDLDSDDLRPFQAPPRPDPWAQLPAEHDEDYSLFQDYLAGPPITLKDFARRTGRTYPYITRLSAQHRWRARRAALHHHLVQARTEAAEAEARDLGRILIQSLHEAAEYALESLLQHRAQGTVLSPDQAIKFLEWASKQDLLRSGRPTEIVDLSARSDAELDVLRAILEGRGLQTPERSDETLDSDRDTCQALGPGGTSSD